MPTNTAQPLRLFLADLHLAGDASVHALRFRALLADLAKRVAVQPVEVYLLGDVFEFWDEYHPQVIARYEDDLNALEAAHRAGIHIFLVDGNRDFLYGRYVEGRLGAHLLRDGARVQLATDFAAWVEHGDLICRADIRYLRYRRRVRSAPARLLFRLLPWFIARRLVDRISARSQADCIRKTPREFDPDLPYARARLLSTACHVLICGHTHRTRQQELGDGLRLIVLPPWCETHAGCLAEAARLSLIHVAEDGRILKSEASA